MQYSALAGFFLQAFSLPIFKEKAARFDLVCPVGYGSSFFWLLFFERTKKSSSATLAIDSFFHILTNYSKLGLFQLLISVF